MSEFKGRFNIGVDKKRPQPRKVGVGRNHTYFTLEGFSEPKRETTNFNPCEKDYFNYSVVFSFCLYSIIQKEVFLMLEATGRRRKRERSYVTIENVMFEDSRMSFKAKGILGYLLTKPDGWKVRIKDLMNHSNEGERSIRSGLKELQENGYLAYYRTKRKNGTFSGIVWEYDDIPFEPDSPENIDAEPSEPQLQNSNVDHNVQNAVVENAVVENVPVENEQVQNRLHISNDFTVSNPDFNNFDNNYQSIIAPQVQQIFLKVYGYPTPKNDWMMMDRINVVINGYYLWASTLTLMDLQRILFQIKIAEDKKPINDFRMYLWKSFDTAGKQIAQAKREENKKENLPDWFEESKENRLAPKKTDEKTLEEKKAEIEEILKDFKK